MARLVVLILIFLGGLTLARRLELFSEKTIGATTLAGLLLVVWWVHTLVSDVDGVPRSAAHNVIRRLARSLRRAAHVFHAVDVALRTGVEHYHRLEDGVLRKLSDVPVQTPALPVPSPPSALPTPDPTTAPLPVIGPHDSR